MFYTNLKFIIHEKNDMDELQNCIEDIKDYMMTVQGINAQLEMVEDEEKGFPKIPLPEAVQWAHLDECLRPNIGFRAINQNMISKAEPELIQVKHELTQDEIVEVSQDMAKALQDRADLESEKAAVNKQFKAEIDKHTNKIWEDQEQIANGYRHDDVECVVRLDFDDKKKYYLDSNDQEKILKVVDLEPQDYQLRIDHTYDAVVDGDGTDSDESDIDSDESGTEIEENVPESAENVPGTENNDSTHSSDELFPSTEMDQLSETDDLPV